MQRLAVIANRKFETRTTPLPTGSCFLISSLGCHQAVPARQRELWRARVARACVSRCGRRRTRLIQWSWAQCPEHAAPENAAGWALPGSLPWRDSLLECSAGGGKAQLPALCAAGPGHARRGPAHAAVAGGHLPAGHHQYRWVAARCGGRCKERRRYHRSSSVAGPAAVGGWALWQRGARQLSEQRFRGPPLQAPLATWPTASPLWSRPSRA